MDYHQMREELACAVQPFKRALSAQRSAFSAIYPNPNFATPDIWGLLSLAKGKIIAEISSGRMLENYVFGVTVLVRDENGYYQKPPFESNMSRCLHSASEVREYLEELDASD